MTLGTVIVATDFSAVAARAVERAATLPIAPWGRLRLVHVMATGARGLAGEAAVRVRLEQAADAARAAAASAGVAEIQIGGVVLEGDPVECIDEDARREAADLIVVGKSGDRPVRALFLGSTADRLIRRSPTPVLVVSAAVAGPYQRPLAAVEGPVSMRALEVGHRVIGRRRAFMGVVHAAPRARRWRSRRANDAARQRRLARRRRVAEALQRFLDRWGDGAARFAIVVRQGNPAEVIVAQAAERQADLVAMGTNGRGALDRLVRGCIATSVVRNASCDVLVARPSFAAQRHR